MLGLIEEALNEAERQAGTGPCEATETEGGSQEQDAPSQGGEEPCEGETGLPASQDE